MIVLFLVESSGTSTWRRPSSTLTQPMGFTPPTPWALSTVLNAIRCLLMGIHDCLSMVIQAKKIHPEKKKRTTLPRNIWKWFWLALYEICCTPPHKFNIYTSTQNCHIWKEDTFSPRPMIFGLSKLNFGHVFCILFNTFFHSGFRSLKTEQVSRCFHWATLRLGRSKSYVSNIQKKWKWFGRYQPSSHMFVGILIHFHVPMLLGMVDIQMHHRQECNHKMIKNKQLENCERQATMDILLTACIQNSASNSCKKSIHDNHS